MYVCVYFCACHQSEKRSSNFMYLMVEFPRVKTNDKEYSIVYYEQVPALPPPCTVIQQSVPYAHNTDIT